jgi:hypothetical protein
MEERNVGTIEQAVRTVFRRIVLEVWARDTSPDDPTPAVGSDRMYNVLRRR